MRDSYKFDKVVLFARTGLNPRQNFKLGNGNNIYITIKNIHNNKLIIDDNTDFVDDDAIQLIHKRSQIKKGDVLFASIGRIGDTYIIENDPVGWDINESVFAFTLNTDIIRQKYFHYYFKCKSVLDYLVRNSSGSTFKSIKMNQLKKMIFDLPSLEEQDRVIEQLDKIDNIVTARAEQIKQLDNLIKARFVELFGDLTFNPYNWPVFEISNICTFLKSGLSRKLSDEDLGLPVIRSGNIQNGQFIYDDIKYWYVNDPQGSNTADYVLDDGDVLVNFINSVSQIGKTAIFRDIGRECIYTTNILRMKLADSCDQYYYSWFAMTDYYYRQLQNIIQPAVNQASFTTVNFLKLRIPIPPIEKQLAFADFVKQVDNSKVAVQKSLTETQMLFDSLMQQYFG